MSVRWLTGRKPKKQIHGEIKRILMSRHYGARLLSINKFKTSEAKQPIFPYLAYLALTDG